MKIFKYILPTYECHVSMPLGANILSCQMLDGKICVWAKVDENKELEQRRFVIYPTGNTIDDSLNLKFIATVQDDWLVWHVFEALPEETYL